MNCDRSRRVEAGGRFTWWRCPLQQSLQRTCSVAAAPCSLKAGLDKRSTCTPSPMVGTPQLWLSGTRWGREDTEGNHWDLSGETGTWWGWASLKPDVALWRGTLCSLSTPQVGVSVHFSVVSDLRKSKLKISCLSTRNTTYSPASLFLLLILGQSSSLSAQKNNITVMVNLTSVSSAH